MSTNNVHWVDEEKSGLLHDDETTGIQKDDYVQQAVENEAPVEILETASKKDIALMIFINFLSFICFAIVLPSLWPFLQAVTKFYLSPLFFLFRRKGEKALRNQQNKQTSTTIFTRF